MEAKDSRQFMSFLLFVQNSTEGEGGRKKKKKNIETNSKS